MRDLWPPLSHSARAAVGEHPRLGDPPLVVAAAALCRPAGDGARGDDVGAESKTKRQMHRITCMSRYTRVEARAFLGEFGAVSLRGSSAGAAV